MDKTNVTANVGWQIDGTVDVLALVAIIFGLLFFVGWLVRMIGTGKLKPRAIRDYFFPNKMDKKEFKRQEPILPDYKPNPLLPDKYAREVLVLVERSIDHYSRLDEIIKDTLTRQMRVYEEQEIAIMALFKKGFIEILKEEGVAADMIPHARKMYSGVVKDLLKEMKDNVRSWCITNHFYEMTEEERKKYVSDKISVIFHIANEHFDDEWIAPVNKVDREHLRRIEARHGDEFKEIIIAIFKRLFKASEACIEKTNEEKAKYSAYVVAISGYDPYDITKVRT